MNKREWSDGSRLFCLIDERLFTAVLGDVMDAYVICVPERSEEHKHPLERADRNAPGTDNVLRCALRGTCVRTTSQSVP